jgi:RNA polymerase-associated protein
MGSTVSRRSSMTLFSKANCLDCHRVRLVLAEKGVSCEIVYPDPERIHEDLLDLSPYGSVPTLVDRDLVLYDGRIILEYLDERFPHPPLMPVDPASRARFRLAMLRMERDWYSVAETLMALSGSAERTALIQKLQDSLKETQRLFASPPYFLGHDFSLVDITMAPLLWRLEQFGIDWTPETKILQEYAERIFQRPAFGRSLSGQEGTMRALSF